MTSRGGLQLRTQEEGVVSPDHYSMREREEAVGGGRGEVTAVVESSGRRCQETAAHRQRHLPP